MGDNAGQIADWNGAVGRRWAELQGDLDRMTRPFGNAALEAAHIAAGERVLDVGCGCGDTSLEIARRIGAQGFLVGVDVSKPMLKVARQRAAAEKLLNLEFREADASRAKLPARQDLIFSRFGVMFFDEPALAFGHLRSALNPGGRIAFCCWRPLNENAWAFVPLAAALKALQLEAPPPLDPKVPGPFAFADFDYTAGVLEQAGFTNVAGRAVDALVRWAPTPAAAGEAAMRVGPLAKIIRNQGEAAQPIARTAVEQALAVYAGGGRDIALNGAVWIMTAESPGF